MKAYVCITEGDDVAEERTVYDGVTVDLDPNGKLMGVTVVGAIGTCAVEDSVILEVSDHRTT